MFADSLKRYLLGVFYDEFVMNVADNKAVFQCLHGIGKNIPTNSLNDIFYKLRTVALNSTPFLVSINPHIGDTLATELVHADTGFNIGKLSAGWQGDK